MNTCTLRTRTLIACSLTTLLAACGGGGSNAPKSASVASMAQAPATYPLAMALATYSANGLTSTLNISGSVLNYSVNGSGTYTVTGAVAATFEGLPALQQAVAVSADVATTGFIPIHYTYSTNGDYDTNSSYQTVGESAPGEYDVATTPYTFPATITVGATGTLGTMDRYSDSTKATLIGKLASSYSVTADTSPSDVIFDEIDQSLDVNGNVTATIEIKYRVTDTGGISLAGVAVTNSKVNLTATAS